MKRIVDRIRIGADLRSATVEDREVSAESTKALRAVLAGALYDVLHAGRAAPEGPRRKSLRDPAFEQALREMVPHRASRLLAQVEPGSPETVRLNGVRVLIPPARLGPEVETPAGPARWIDLPSALPALSPGFFLVNGSLGHGLSRSACLRLYVGATGADAAPGLWGAVLGRLEELAVPYRAKVLSARDLYPRRDAIVVYLGPDAWRAVPDVAGAATAAGGLREDRSLYVAGLGPGLGWAWEPEDTRPEMRGMSFGEHRSHAIAAGLIAHAADGGDREQAVDRALRTAGISPDAVHRNLGSPPLPFETTGLTLSGR